jgi:hypothetical protein
VHAADTIGIDFDRERTRWSLHLDSVTITDWFDCDDLNAFGTNIKTVGYEDAGSVCL